jgi:hypothetical protein
MSTFSRRTWPVVLFLIFLAPAARGEDRPLSRKYLDQVKEAARQLTHDLEQLQDALVAELKGQKERTHYRQADVALGAALSFQRALKDGASRADLYKSYDALDEKLRVLFKGAGALGEGHRGIHRALSYVSASDDQLHYALSEGDLSAKRTAKVIERQARAMSATARELHEVAAYAFGDDPGRGVLQKELDTLARSAEQFQKGLATNSQKRDLQRQFEAVNASWVKVTEGLKGLAPEENAYLLRGAARMDRLHERLFRLLDIKGERPQLIIRT